MLKLRTLIVDDEPLARERIRSLLVDDHEIEVIGECSNGREAVSAIRQQKPDLLFLDIQMPELDGFSVIESIGADNMPLMIFITAFDSYALQAFETCALDYLLKPFDNSRFKRALERAKNRFTSLAGNSLELNRQLLTFLENTRLKQDFLQRVLVKTTERLSFLETEKIDWIRSEGNYVCLHVRNSSYLLRESITNLEAKLNPANFIRISRSTIVNIDRVKELQQMFHGDFILILDDGTELKMSRRFRDRLPQVVVKR
jgi:two-component system, LytTR family, response regulator